jgi:hypothetical protein
VHSALGRDEPSGELTPSLVLPDRAVIVANICAGKLSAGHELRIAGNVRTLRKVAFSNEGEDYPMTDLRLERPAQRALPSGPGKGPGGALLPLSSGSKRCPVIGCDERIDPSRLMCRRDWYRVPYAIRARIWATWRSGEAAFSPEHLGAVHEALAFAQAARSALGASRPCAGVRLREARYRS